MTCLQSMALAIWIVETQLLIERCRRIDRAMTPVHCAEWAGITVLVLWLFVGWKGWV